jgi:lipid A 3-O-deacylase
VLISGTPPPPPTFARRNLAEASAGALGNVAIYGDVDGTARIGKNLRDDFGPTRLFAGIDGLVVGRNIFLNGNSDGNSLRVSHRPCVAEAQAGLALTYHGVRFPCTQVLRTPKFYDQNRYTQFGSINVTFRY